MMFVRQGQKVKKKKKPPLLKLTYLHVESSVYFVLEYSHINDVVS